MMTIGFFAGLFIAMYCTDTVWTIIFFPIIGVWLGAILGARFSENRKTDWILNRREALRTTITVLLSWGTFFLAMQFTSNSHIGILVFVAAFMFFHSWRQIWQRSVAWKHLCLIFIGCLGGIYAGGFFPHYISVFCPIAGWILAEWIYGRFFLDKDADFGREFIAHIFLYGELAAIDGAPATQEELDFFASRFLNTDQKMLTQEEDEMNRDFLEMFNSAVTKPAGWKKAVREYARMVQLNDHLDLFFDELLYDICIFSMLRGNGELSEEKRKALMYLGKELAVPAEIMKDILDEMKAFFESRNEASQPVDDSISIDKCFEILGCKRNDDFTTVKAAYRMKCKLNHPDKVRSYGLGDEAVGEATRRTQQITDAYTRIKTFKGWA